MPVVQTLIWIPLNLGNNWLQKLDLVDRPYEYADTRKFNLVDNENNWLNPL